MWDVGCGFWLWLWDEEEIIGGEGEGSDLKRRGRYIGRG